MSYANDRYQTECRNLVVSVMTADELAQWVNGYNTACTLLGLDCGARDASADLSAHAVATERRPADCEVDYLRAFVAERVAKLKDRCANDVIAQARRLGRLSVEQ